MSSSFEDTIDENADDEDDEDDEDGGFDEEGDTEVSGTPLDLTGRQRRELRALGHHLEPVIHVGKAGLSSTLFEELDRALELHELVKVRFTRYAPEGSREAGPFIAGRLGCAFVQALGRTALFFRPASDPEARKIKV